MTKPNTYRPQRDARPLAARRSRSQQQSTSARYLLAAATLLGLFLEAGASWATVRPDPLAPEPGCDRWVGKAGGNDPSVEVDLVVCQRGEGVEGQLQWSSLQSGWNLRAVAGRWTNGGSTLELEDVKIVKEKPNPGWRFCPIDRYELHREGEDRLEGHYVSTPCRDRASVSLERRPTQGPLAAPADAGASPEGAPTAPASSSRATPNPSSEPTPPREGSRDGPGAPEGARSACSCSAMGRETSHPVGVLLLVVSSSMGAIGACRRRRRRLVRE